VSTEVASTRLPKEILREIDREASARGMSRSVYLAELIERGTLRDHAGNRGTQIEALTAVVLRELRDIRESQRSLAHGLRDMRAAAEGSPPAGAEAKSPLIERLAFSTFFSEALIKRVSALLYRNPSELGHVVRDAREQADAEVKVWRERLHGREPSKEAS
jgi:hypothetical protein